MTQKNRILISNDPFKVFLQSLQQEYREIKALLESFEGREFYENKKEKLNQKIKDLNLEKQKVLAGKTLLKNLFKSTSKEAQVEEIEANMANVTKIS